MGLGQLLRRLAKVDGIERLRYTTPHPRDMDDALIKAHADLPELMPYLHACGRIGGNPQSRESQACGGGLYRAG